MPKTPLYFVVLSLLFACSTKESDVRVYRVGKALVPETGVAAGKPPAASSTGELKWDSPKGWKQLPGNDIRLASFEVPAKQGASDASIVVLGGDAGGLEANVNRWREQAGLAPESAENIAKAAESGKSGIGEYRMFMLEGSGGKASILVAVFSLPGKSLFVKMTGKQDALAAQKAGFVALCKSIRTESAAR